MARYRIEFSVWPVDTQDGRAKDQFAVGDRERHFDIVADDFDHAIASARLLMQGVKANPRVWQCPIRSIICQGD